MQSHKRINLFLLLILVTFFSCENMPSNTDQEADNELLNQEQTELTDAKINELFDTVFSEYKDAKQVTLFSPDSLEKHIMYIDLGEETLIKNISKDFTIEEEDNENLLPFHSLSVNSSCDDLLIAKIYDEDDDLIHNMNHTICDNDPTGNISFGVNLGSEQIWRVFYQSNTSVSFPGIALFTTSWLAGGSGSNMTTWEYRIDSPYRVETTHVDDPYTTHQFDQSPYVRGSDRLYINNLGIDKTPFPSTPVLTSPGNGDKIEIAWWPLKWNASSGNPSYEVDVNCGSSYNNTFSTNNTTFYLPSGISTGLTCTWKVRATNAAGSSNWSSQRTFETIPGALVSGTTTIPVNGAGSWSASVTGGTSPYTFEWQRKLTCKIGHSCSGTSWHTAAGSGNTVYFSWANEYQQIQYKARVKDGNSAWSEWSPVHQAFFN